jgi:hypothetical protein
MEAVTVTLSDLDSWHLVARYAETFLAKEWLLYWFMTEIAARRPWRSQGYLFFVAHGLRLYSEWSWRRPQFHAHVVAIGLSKLNFNNPCLCSEKSSTIVNM